MKYPYRIAIIDLGTNSLRVGLYEIKDWMEWNCLHQHKSMVRLGDGVFETGFLDPEAKMRTFVELTEIKKQMGDWKINHVVGYATSALRTAADGPAFATFIEKKLGFPIKIISGEEEAILIAKGVLTNQRTPAENFLLVDIGGGSTEINWCQGKLVYKSLSFRLGANRIKQLFFDPSPHPQTLKGKADSIKNTRKFVKEELLKQTKKVPKAATLMGSSGTIRAVRKMLKAAKKPVDPFLGSDLSTFVQKISYFSPDRLLKIPGMEPKRVDLIIPGAIILDEVVKTFGIKKIYTTPFTLRDGILEEVLEKFFY